MHRECSRCGKPYTSAELADAETWCMELERKAAGVEGARFAFYRCRCGMTDIFVEVIPLDDEFVEDFEGRCAAMEGVARNMHDENVRAVVVPAGVLETKIHASC